MIDRMHKAVGSSVSQKSPSLLLHTQKYVLFLKKQTKNNKNSLKKINHILDPFTSANSNR